MFFKTSLEIKEALFYPAPSIFVAYMIEKLLLFLYPHYQEQVYYSKPIVQK